MGKRIGSLARCRAATDLESGDSTAGRPGRAVVDATGSQAEGPARHTWRSLLQRRGAFQAVSPSPGCTLESYAGEALRWPH